MYALAPTEPYERGIEYPAKGTIFAPLSTWKSYSLVFLNSPDSVAMHRIRDAVAHLETLDEARGRDFVRILEAMVDVEEQAQEPAS